MSETVTKHYYFLAPMNDRLSDGIDINPNQKKKTQKKQKPAKEVKEGP